MTTYERPTGAKLVVRLDNGEEWEATPADLDKFGYGRRLDLYGRATTMLLEAIQEDRFEDGSPANAVRYLVECALMYDHSPWSKSDGSPWEGEDDGTEIREQIRQALGGTE